MRLHKVSWTGSIVSGSRKPRRTVSVSGGAVAQRLANSRRTFVVMLLAAMGALASFGFAPAAQAASKTSSAVAYVTDFGSGSNDTCGPGCGSSIWVNALTGSPPLGSYTTADSTKTVSVTDVPVSAVDAGGVAALTPFDTVIVYQVCDIASHPATVAALNTFLNNGGKVMLFDADACAPGVGGLADYSTFLFPFTTSSPGPLGASGSYTTVVPSTLTTGLSPGPQPYDAVGDANIFTSFSGSWCASITATNVLGANGFVEATARTPSGGLVIYEGEDFWFTDTYSTHLRQVFDDMLEQNWAPDGLPCTIPASGISLAPLTQTQTTGGSATLTATIVDINGNPVGGGSVSFSVTSGPNSGQTGSGTTNSSGQASFTYPDTGGSGTDSVVASFVDSSGATHTSNTASVIWAAPTDPAITAKGTTVSATEGQSFSGTVATFSDPDTSATAGEYSASINWGDGSSASSGTITGSGGSFTVSGGHTYADEGSYTITVTITDVDNSSNSATATSNASVADAAISASCGTPAVSLQSVNGTVASLSDANTGAPTSDFTATINWGDGSPTSSGTVTGSGGSYSITGSHSYTSTGYYNVTTTVTDDGGSHSVTPSCKVLVYAFAPGGGSFVIGNGNSATNTAVTFWGAQWWKLNTLSGGAAPASFKGYALNPKVPACGTGWTTDPGNSAPPPAGPLPAYMGVIVTSSSSQSGSQISGNTVHIVIVKTNPGYQNNPGHAGTGTVVVQVC